MDSLWLLTYAWVIVLFVALVVMDWRYRRCKAEVERLTREAETSMAQGCGVSSQVKRHHNPNYQQSRVNHD